MRKRRKLPKAPKYCYWRNEDTQPVLWARIKLGGEDRRFSLRTDNVALARRRVREERERIIGERHFGEIRHAYRKVFVDWGEHIVTEVGAGTAKRYGSSLAQLEPDLKTLFIDEIDKAKVQAIVKRRRAAGATNATIRRDLTALSSIFRYCEDHDYCEGNPALSVLKTIGERRDPIVLPRHADIHLVAIRAGQMLGTMARTALKTGCRLSELTGALRDNLDHASKQLLVIGKGKKLRPIQLDRETYAELKALPIRLGCRLLFYRADGTSMRDVSSAFRYVVQAELKAARQRAQEAGAKEPDFRRFTFHHLRHRFAVDWLKSGRSLYDLQKHLGHTSITTTEGYLEFLTPEEQRRVQMAGAQAGAHLERLAHADR
jgi:integrase/recombinase XerD